MSACVVDTNVAIVANNKDTPDELIDCAIACIEVIEKVIKKKSIVLDEQGEIFDEYRHKLSLSGQPGVGDKFLKWVHDNQWSISEKNRVAITKNGDSYNEFPADDDLSDFDLSDRKFVAVANAHPDKPKIYQATDSKWWGWKDALYNVGITVDLICPDYIEQKYKEKMVQDP
jgi:hypothetical protein